MKTSMLMPDNWSFLFTIPPFHLMLAECSSVSWLHSPLKLSGLGGTDFALWTHHLNAFKETKLYQNEEEETSIDDARCANLSSPDWGVRLKSPCGHIPISRLGWPHPQLRVFSQQGGQAGSSQSGVGPVSCGFLPGLEHLKFRDQWGFSWHWMKS